MHTTDVTSETVLAVGDAERGGAFVSVRAVTNGADGQITVRADLSQAGAVALRDELNRRLADKEATNPATFEVLVVRDPDGGDDVTVFIGGEQAVVPVEVVDPGCGWLLSDWLNKTRAVETDPGLSRGFRCEVSEAYTNYIGSQHITEDIEL